MFGYSRREAKNLLKEWKKKMKIETEAARAQESQAREPKREINIVYLWISHGSSVSGINKNFGVETKFKQVGLFSEFLTPIYSDILKEIQRDECKLFTHIKMRPEEMIERKKVVFLPPLVFQVYADEKHESIRYFSGLHRFEFEFYDNSCVRNLHSELIFDHSGLVTKFGSRSNIAYSEIFKVVTDDCKKRKIEPNIVTLGIYSCQTIHPDYKQYYPILYLTESFIKEPPQANIVDTIVPGEIGLPLVIPLTERHLYTLSSIKGWDALAKLTKQGCALNVLSYYNILPEIDAREKTVCLTLKGTSIYKIIDYINVYSINKYRYDGKYIIFRFSILNGLSLSIYIAKHNLDRIVIFKMYGDKMYNGKPSQIGHTVSIINSGGIIRFIDPQVKKSVNIQLLDRPDAYNQAALFLLDYFRQEYGGVWNYVDIVYTLERQTTTIQSRSDLTSETLQSFLQFWDCEILPADRTSIIHGGYENKRQNKRKSNTKKRSKKHSKKYSKTRHRK